MPTDQLLITKERLNYVVGQVRSMGISLRFATSNPPQIGIYDATRRDFPEWIAVAVDVGRFNGGLERRRSWWISGEIGDLLERRNY